MFKIPRRVTGAYFISVVSISMVLFIIGLLALFLVNASRISREARKNIIMTVFLNEDTKTADIDRITKQLKVAPFTRNAKYVSSEAAGLIMVKELGNDFTEVLGYNALPPSVEINLKADYISEDSINAVKKSLRKYHFIKEIYYQKKEAQLINNNINKLSFTGLIITILLLLISVTLIQNAVRLSVHAKRFVIKTAQLIGGTQNFIRKPFVIKTILSGILAASFSSLALALLVLFLQDNYENIISAEGIWLIVFIMYFAGIVISGLAGYFAVNKYLETDESKLFFEG